MNFLSALQPSSLSVYHHHHHLHIAFQSKLAGNFALRDVWFRLPTSHFTLQHQTFQLSHFTPQRVISFCNKQKPTLSFLSGERLVCIFLSTSLATNLLHDLMGNIISSFFSGFGKVFSDLFDSPLDFFEGKSCSSVCQSTWDFICFIENFCVANLLKMATVLVLVYIVLLFFYLLQKLGICECICQSLFRIVWACIASWFHAWEYCCIFLCVKLRKLKRVRRKHRRDIEEEFDAGADEYDTSEEEYDEESFSNHVPRHMEKSRSVSHKWKDYRGAHLRKSLRPRNHRIRVDIGRDSIHSGRRNHIKHRNHGSTVHDIRVTRTSKFAHKGRNYRGEVVKHRRR